MEADDGSRTTVVLVDGDVRMAVVHVVGPEPPDLTVVAALARLNLMAGRMGWSIRIENPCLHLSELLELTGLSGVLLAPHQRRPGGDPAGEPGGEPEPGPGSLDAWLAQLDGIDLDDDPDDQLSDGDGGTTR